MENKELEISNEIMKNKRKSFLITHKKDLIILCKVIGGTKGEIFSYLINNIIFTDNTVKATYKKISKATEISYVSVAKAMKEFEDNGLIKRKNGYLMVAPTLLIRGDYQAEIRLIREFKNFNENMNGKYTTKIKSYPKENESSEVLVLSSDSTKGREKNSTNYYSKKTDDFWTIIFSILKVEDPINYGDRVNILLKNNIALWDVMHIVQNIENDKMKKHREYNDFSQFLATHKNIKYILCNGEETYKLLKKIDMFDKLDNITIIKLPSSSPSRGKYLKTPEDKLSIWKDVDAFKKVFIEEDNQMNLL